MRTHAKATVVVSALLLALAFAASPAQAAKGVFHVIGAGAGAGDGQLSTPRQVAIRNSTGEVFVADAVNNRVQRFSAAGAFLSKFGSAGSAAGQLSTPTGIAIDQGDGSIYVYDQGNRRVAKYDAAGGFLFAFGAGVADGLTDALQTCTAVCFQGVSSAAEGGFATTTAAPGLAVAPQGSPDAGDLFVADPANNRVQQMEAPGIAGPAAFVAKVGASGTGNGQFGASSPTRVAVDKAGRVYAVDNGNFRIQRFTSALAFDQVFNPSGATGAGPNVSGTNANTAPVDVAVDPDDEHVFVAKNSNTTANGERRVYEFDPALVPPAGLLDTHMAGAGLTAAPTGFGLDTASGRIFVATNQSANNRAFILDTVAAPLVTLDPVEDQTATTATFEGSVNPNGAGSGSATSYRFEYSADGGATWQTTVSPDIQLGPGTSPIAVQTTQSALLPNTDYQVRIVAAKPFGNPGTTGAPVSFTTDPAPPLISTAATVAGEESAELHNLVDPRGSNVTQCRFDWGPTSAYGSSVPCDSSPGAGQGWKLVSATLQGLTPGSTYHYRTVATGAAGTTNGPDRTVVVGAQLPDQRAWEMVSPPDKNGGNVFIESRRSRAAQELAPGQPMAFVYSSLVAFADARGMGVTTNYIAERGAERWRTHSITPTQDSQTSGSITVFRDPIYDGELSADLSRGVLRVNPSDPPLTAGAPNAAKVQNLYLRTDLRTPGAGSYSLLTDSLFPQPPSETYVPTFGAASEDFSVIGFDSTLNLTADASGSAAKAYEWEGGAVRLVGRVPASGHSCDDLDGPACVPAASSVIDKGFGYVHPDAVSTDGSKVFFTSPAAATGQIYMRVGGRRTVHLNASERTTPEASLAARLETTTPDGSRVFFTTLESLVDSDTDSNVDLYMYDTTLPESDPHNLTQISEDAEPADGITASVDGTIGASRDGETVYFVAGRRLVPEAKQAPGPGGRVYVWRNGVIRYIGKLGTAAEGSDNSIGSSQALGGTLPSRVTPDGSHALFFSSSGNHLTGYDHGACGTDGCRELYLYDADANGGDGELQCVSCRPDGVPASSHADAMAIIGGGGTRQLINLNHPLSDDGRFVSFHTGEPLVPHDTNGRFDVYRYDSRNGQLALISGDGESPTDSYLLDSAGNGRDVFFATREQLSGWDFDNAYDVYDARIGGGLPEPPAPVPSCAGDACQPAPAALNDPTPSSSSFQGKGNPRASRARKAKRCPQGKRRVKRRGKTACVKRKPSRANGRKTNRTHTERRAGR